MSFIQIRDQFGNPPPASGRLDVALTPKGFSTPQDRRFTDNAGNVSFTGCELVWPTANGDFVLSVNTANVNPDYGDATLHVSDIEAQAYTITVAKLNAPQPSACPVNHDKGQFEKWFWDLVAKYNEPTCTNDAMQRLATKPEFMNCQMLWQNQKVYAPAQWRPRIFQPPQNPPNYDSPWPYDCGSYGSPWVLTPRY